MERSPELAAMIASDEAEIEDRRVRRKQIIGSTALALGGIALAYASVFAPEKRPQDISQGDEEFTATTFRPPSFLRPADNAPQKPPEDLVQITVPAEVKPEPADTTPFNVPPPPGLAERNAERDMPQDIAEVFPKRFLSKQIVVDSARPDKADAGLGAGSEVGATVSGDDRHSKFLASASAVNSRTAKARQLGRLDALVPEGTLIPGILETAINSDLPGQVRAIVSQDVYSFDGRRILISTGTRLIGEYQSDVMRGQKRIFVIWTRMLRDDGVSVRLNSIGTDSLGRSGLTGQVDNKWRERFGSAILLSVVGAGSSYLVGYTSGENGSDDGSETSSDRAAELARETIARTFSDMANQALGENLKIPPTIHVHQGERIFVYVRQDLDFSDIYVDPVEQALKEIKNERGLGQTHAGR